MIRKIVLIVVMGIPLAGAAATSAPIPVPPKPALSEIEGT